MTANQLFKAYKDDGGTLNFSAWLTREKTKGVFPLNKEANEEVYMAMNGMEDKSKTVFGFPSNTFIIVGAIIVAALVYTTYSKKLVK